MSEDWASLEITGPDCTLDQAEDLYVRLAANQWPNQPTNPGATMELYVRKLQQWPYTLCSLAIDSIIDHDKYFPTWNVLKDAIEEQSKKAARAGKPLKVNS